MKSLLSLVLFVALVAVFTSSANAQGSDGSAPSAAENAADLRARLVEAQAQEAELQMRLRQLDEDMKPENIQRSLAGVGSTRPEELREQVRQQLTIQRDGVSAQLKIVTANRERLESSVRFAEAQAYQQSAENASVTPTLLTQLGSSRWLIVGVAGLLAIFGVLAVVVMRRTRTT